MVLLGTYSSVGNIAWPIGAVLLPYRKQESRTSPSNKQSGPQIYGTDVDTRRSLAHRPTSVTRGMSTERQKAVETPLGDTGQGVWSMNSSGSHFMTIPDYRLFWLKVLVIFFGPSRQILGCYFMLDQDDFLPLSIYFIIRWHLIIGTAYLSYWVHR